MFRASAYAPMFPFTGTAALVTRDYQGAPFVFREDGFFNMTRAAKHFGKRLDAFMGSKDVAEYALAVAQYLAPERAPNSHKMCELKSNKYRVSTSVVRESGLVEVGEGRSGGTWAHPKLAVFFARWLDVRFAVWCDMVIDDILRKKAEVVITKPQESAVLALPESYSGAMFA